MRGLEWSVPLLVLGLALVAGACAGNGDEEEVLGPSGTPPSSPAATPISSAASETALREAVTIYMRAIARPNPDLAALYALESAEFRETCPFDEYVDLITPLLWPELADDCGYDETSRVDFSITGMETHQDWALVGGCHQDQQGRECCLHDYIRWNHRDGRWAPAEIVPCAYALENERLLATLPQLPGARQVSIHSYAYFRGEAGPADRHAIRVTYEAPSGVSAQDVIDFYVQSFGSEWQYAVPDIGGASWLAAQFTQGTAEVSIDTANMTPPGHKFDVHVDYRGAEPRWAEGPTPGPSAAATGKIAFTSDRDSNAEIYVMNADGTDQTNLTNNPAYDFGPAWSPDGSRIAFSSDRDSNAEIYVMNADGTGLTNLTNNPAYDFGPAWSPDGSRIAFSSDRDGNDEVYVMNADGSGLARLTNNPTHDGVPDWSPDGTRIAFDSDRDNNAEIYVMNADGTDPRNLTNDPAYDFGPDWSPDGSRIAFSSVRDDNPEVYVMNADGSGRTRLSNNPGEDAFPAWSPDGSRIAFDSDRDNNAEIYVMNADGTDPRNLTNNRASDVEPVWSPAP